MWTERLRPETERVEQTPAGFVAVPMFFVGFANAAAFQQQLYTFAFEQARRTMLERQQFAPRELFAIMN